MRLACLGFVAGAWVLQQQALLPSSQWSMSIIALALLALVFARKISLSWLRHTLVIAAAITLGFAWAGWRADLRLSDRLDSAIEGRDVQIIGTIESLPYVFEQGVRFEFRVESSELADGKKISVPRSISLSWYAPAYGGAAGGDAGAAVPQIAPGERWRLTVRLKKPHGNANPQGFDYEYWLLEQNLRATGYVRPTRGDAEHANQRLDAFVWSFGHVIESMRALLRQRIIDALPGHPYAGVITALVVGDQRNIDQSDWQVYNRTGIGHLISISGLHITMIAGALAALVYALWRRSMRLMHRLAAHKAAALAGALVGLLYCLLAGFGVPAQRTLYMLGIVALALWLGRMTSATQVLCMALVVVVGLDPWAVMAAGFWLSFGAVAAIFYVMSGRIEDHLLPSSGWAMKARHTLEQGARIQWAVTLGLMPLTMLLFHQVSLVSPLANAIAIPLVSLIVTPLALCGALLAAVLPSVLSTLLLQAAHGLMALLAATLGWMSVQPAAVWSTATPSAWAFVCALIGVGWCLAPRGVPLRWFGLIWLVPLFAWPPDRPDAGALRLTTFDIGQGMAVLIETAEHTLLYDTGPQYGLEDLGDNNAGARTIVPYLRAQGIERIDTMIVSHNDNDHSGGALAILAQVPVAQVYSSLAFDSPMVQAAGARHVRCEAGQQWTIDGVRFDMLHPVADTYEQQALKPNARSCVLRLQLLEGSAGSSVLLAGDIERPQEADLVAHEIDPQHLQSDVLLVPHHGSLTSSSAIFLDAVRPKIALIQSGYRNRFGHPKAEVVQRYVERGVTVLRNDEGGALMLTLDGRTIKTEAYRQVHRRYWYGP